MSLSLNPNAAGSGASIQYNNVDVITVTSNSDIIHNVNSAAPTLSVNNQMVFELTSDTSLKIKVRGSDGVTRSTTLTLS